AEDGIRERNVTGVQTCALPIYLRIKAALIGLTAEDYYNDKVLEDLDLLYTGHETLPDDFWQTHGRDMDSWQDDGGHTFYRLTPPQAPGWHINELLHFDEDNDVELITRTVDN